MATSTTVSSSPSMILLQQNNDSNNEMMMTTNKLEQPTDENTEQRLKQIDELKYFLGTATNDWELNKQVNSFLLPTGESLSCVFWNDLFHVTGTDIVRTLLYRFHLFGRPVTNLKKFEEGIFSDLRNLKPGMDASLEEPKSEFLEMLYKNNCIRTQKKQKVFFWFSVPHDRLFLDALERDLKREKMGLEPTSVSVAEPATSLSLDTTQELFDQLRKSMSLSAVATAHAMDEVVIINSNNDTTTTADSDNTPTSVSSSPEQKSNSIEKLGHRSTRSLSSIPNIIIPTSSSSAIIQSQPYFDDDYKQTSYSAGTSPKSSSIDLLPSQNDPDETEKQKIFGAFSLFEGSPTYKQRQRRRTLSFNTHGFLNEEDYQGSRLELAAINAGLAIMHPQHVYQQSNHHHELSSGAEKVYTCPLPQCARLFKRLEHLKRHFRTHTMERPYSCNMCGKHFSRTDNLAQHKKTHNRTRSSSGLTRCNSSGKLTTLNKLPEDAVVESNTNITRRKRASSLRHSYNYNEIIDKLSILTSNDVPTVVQQQQVPPPQVSNTNSAPLDYFSYQGGDMSRCHSSPSGSIPLSDEDIMYPTHNHSYEDVIPFNITEEDICMTDEMNHNNNAAAAVMYDEEEENVPYDNAFYGPFLPNTTTTSYMYQQSVPMMGPSCSTTSSTSSLLFNNNQQQQNNNYRLSWYSSIDDISPRSTSPTLLYDNNINTTTDISQIYSWQQAT